ncbi:proteasome assembly chaperone family protein [Picrophilus oshimae]|uniref:Hypothetical DUF75 protein n=1 Tax=Picrophilus torridus (strain ATCC 700027 / DSM 9790 / JCM 10055 / NBRC 100828 / KAW 2/3) TaxID=1122961 RepID=Q6L213_PICTO|nr:proteasome assembly chaperone family protein [Picrophilus oshimae]AAT42989.1 hypothetical DUF75 protein [Picrophilus oshimae DSM 9789]SMD30710.1 hypothetical protein SAMN02745355_0604 [Picrophilus oshimae DSM 9789]
MEKIVIKYYKKPRLSNPVLISGLPGIGNVGKITVDYLIEKLKPERLLDIISEHFPPQVFIDSNSVVSIAKNTMYYKKRRGKSDLIFLTGDFQGTSQEGQYELSSKILEICKELKVSMIYTLGGYSIGRIVDNPRVLGAVTDIDLIDDISRAGVIFPKGEPAGGIVGSAGLMLGLGKEVFNMKGACLMGETSGYFADPKGAIAILRALTRIIDVTVDEKDIEEKARQIEEITEKMKEETTSKNRDDLNYFG